MKKLRGTQFTKVLAGCTSARLTHDGRLFTLPADIMTGLERLDTQVDRFLDFILPGARIVQGKYEIKIGNTIMRLDNLLRVNGVDHPIECKLYSSKTPIEWDKDKDQLMGYLTALHGSNLAHGKLYLIHVHDEEMNG